MAGGNHMILLRINNVNMPNPTTYQVQKSDLDGTGTTRSITGVLHRERIRADIVKISVGWDSLTYNQLSTIINNISNESFSVSYFDGSNVLKTITAYVGDKTLDLVAVNSNNITDNRWNLKCNFVQY